MSSISTSSADPSFSPQFTAPVLTLSPPSTLDADQLLKQRDYSSLYKQCEEKELNEAGIINSNNNQQDISFLLQLIAAALNNDLIVAKLVWKRIPTELKKRTPAFKLVWKVITNLITKNFSMFYSEAATLLSNPNQLLSKTIVIALIALVEETQTNFTQLIANSYINLPIDTLNNYWGTTRAESIERAKALGWAVDENNNSCAPNRLSSNKSTNISIDQLNELTNYVLQLESD
jgi:COP9 signalosome complex subunit 8